MIVQLDSENADLDLTSQVTVLTHTPDASNPMLCQGLVKFGDGAKDLDGTGGDFRLTVTVGGVVIEPDPQIVSFSTATRNSVWTEQFPVPADEEVMLKVTSPNGADTDVDVTAYLYQVDAVDVVAVSGDSAAADNIESQYDGTGLTGDNYPTKQSQLAVLSTASGTLNKVASSATVTTGTETLTYEATEELDASYHEIAPDGGNIEMYYEFTLVGNGAPSSVLWDGYVQSNLDTVTVKAYNWAGSVWETVGSIDGASTTTRIRKSFDLTVAHVGTNANAGKVRVQFTSATATNLATDRILCAYALLAESVGYANGEIWVDTNASNTDTTPYVDGVADNPVSTWAAALTLSTATGINSFHIINGSSITLSATTTNCTLSGSNWDLDLNTQNIDGSCFYGANVTGVAVGTLNGACFYNCILDPDGVGGLSFQIAAGDTKFYGCGLGGGIIIAAAGTGSYYFDSCYAAVAGGSVPYFDFGAAVGNTDVHIKHYSGPLEVKNMGQSGTDLLAIEGFGSLILNSNCDPTGAPDVTIRGLFTLTDNVAGGFVAGGGTISDDARYDVGQILSALTDDSTQIDGSALNAIMEDWTDDGRLDVILDSLASRLTAARAGYLDYLNIGGSVASQSDVQGITQAQRVRVCTPPQMGKPDSGSTDYRIWIYAYDEQHKAEDLDSNPTVAVENNVGTDRSANLSAVQKEGGSTGIYYVDYTVADSHAIEGLVFRVDATEGGVTTQYPASSVVVDPFAIDFTPADRAKLDELHDNRLTAGRASNLDNLDAAVSSRSSHDDPDPSGYIDAAISSRSSHTAVDVTGGTTVAAAESNIRGADGDTLKTLSDQVDGISLTAAAIADAVWDEATAEHTAAGSFGAKNQRVVPSETIVDYKADVSALATSVQLASVETSIRGADGDTLKTLSDQVDGISLTAAAIADAVWDEATAEHIAVGSFGAKNQRVVPSESAADYKADVSALATAAQLSSLNNFNPATDRVLIAGTKSTLDELNDISVSSILAGVIDGSRTVGNVLKRMHSILATSAISNEAGAVVTHLNEAGETEITVTYDLNSGTRTVS